LKKIVCLSIFLIVFSLTGSGFAKTQVALSADKIKAGEAITINGAIAPGQELVIVISSEKKFSTASAAGVKEKINLTKAAEKWDFASQTSIPYLYYVITSNPQAYGLVKNKSYGGAFFFKGLYKTQMFKFKEWEELQDSAKSVLAPIETKRQWNFLRYAHENVFGINTIGKERNGRGKVVIFSRSVVADFNGHPHYWNKGTKIDLNKDTGKFSAAFTTFKHTAPNTAFNVCVNGEQVGGYVVESKGFWLSRGWRYKNPLLIVIGGIIAGTLYSMLGASGGLLMAAFQVMFIGTAGPLGVNGANVLKPSNLPLVFFAPLSGLYRYWFKEHRLVWPVAIFFGIGLFIGSFWIGPPLSAKYLNLAVYKPWLGVMVLIMVVRTLYELTPRVMEKRKAVKKVTEAFSLEVKNAQQEERKIKLGHIKTIKFNLFSYHFSFWGQQFKTNIALFLLIGIFIGIVNASFGIGGGFLLVPAMTMFAGFPMYLAVPISLFASMCGCAAAVGRFMLMGYFPDIWIVLAIVIGGMIGGLIGSRLQPRFSEKQLKTALAVILFLLVFRFLGVVVWF